MTRTIAESQAVVDAWKESGKVMTVGVQSMADPTWMEAHKYIAAGNIGHVLQGQTSYFRNSSVGQWRYYPLTKEMSPKTIDWKAWLGNEQEVAGEKIGPAEADVPFDRAVWAQWRCYWPFGGGMFTDLFVHQTTHLIAAMGVRYPRAAWSAAGGIYLEYDGRDVPDVATVVADYEEGCQVIISATMCQRHATGRGDSRAARDAEVHRRRRLHERASRCTGRTSPAGRPSRRPRTAPRSSGVHLQEPQEAATPPTRCGTNYLAHVRARPASSETL